MHDTDRYLETLTLDSEFVGVVGRGYPGSFYKVFVRASPKSGWVVFEGSSMKHRDPLKDEERLAVAGRLPIVWAPLAFLVDYRVIPGKPALDALVERVRVLLS